MFNILNNQPGYVLKTSYNFHPRGANEFKACGHRCAQNCFFSPPTCAPVTVSDRTWRQIHCFQTKNMLSCTGADAFLHRRPVAVWCPPQAAQRCSLCLVPGPAEQLFPRVRSRSGQARCGHKNKCLWSMQQVGSCSTQKRHLRITRGGFLLGQEQELSSH